MELLDPLTVQNVGFAAGNVLDVVRVDEHHLEATFFENLVDRDPVHARGLHRHGLDLTGLKPVRETVQISREGIE